MSVSYSSTARMSLLRSRLSTSLFATGGLRNKVTSLVSSSGKKKAVTKSTKASGVRKASTSTVIAAESVDVPLVDAPALHKSVSSWVVFSDLHVKPQSIDTCQRVLHKVHEEAVTRQAGIVFLGDFWHVRGALQVELLNRILMSLRSWNSDIPVIMIPGNHDQVSLGGQIHALEPLQYAFHRDQIMMISEPCIALNALWLPYRRDHELLQNILTSSQQHISTGNVNAIFCHTDVKGALMNDNIRSREGMDITAFPYNVPIYSGHFHKPHQVVHSGSTSMKSKAKVVLNYIGSPYQTSLSEAHQDKYLTHLYMQPSVSTSSTDSTGASATRSNSNSKSKSEGVFQWIAGDRIGIDVGKRFFKLSSIRDSRLQQFGITIDGNESSTEPNVDLWGYGDSFSARTIIRAGDRVVLPVDASEIALYSPICDTLKSKGVEVELRHENLDVTLRAARAMRAMKSMSSNGEVDLVALQTYLEGEGSNSNSKYSQMLNNLRAQAQEGADKGQGVRNINEAFEYRDPLSLFAEYVEVAVVDANKDNASTGVDSTGTARAEAGVERVETVPLLKDKILSQGTKVLRDILSQGSSHPSSNPSSEAVGAAVKLHFDAVELENFGPFGGGTRVSYPLSNRGLVLIRGLSNDGTGADSNGAGKSTLVMSILWALTGSLDTRLVADSRALDVAYDVGAPTTFGLPTPSGDTASDTASNKKRTRKPPTQIMAEVAVRGSVNDQPFVITRRRSAKKYELSLIVNNEDLTCQSIKDTQLRIDALMGTRDGLLQRSSFFGQHSHATQSLLGLTDAGLKTALGAMVDTDIWISAASYSRSQERENKNRINEIEIEVKLRREELHKIETEYSLAKSLLGGLESDYLALQQDSLSSKDKYNNYIRSLQKQKGQHFSSSAHLSRYIGQREAEVDAVIESELQPLLSVTSNRGNSMLKDDEMSEVEVSISTYRERLNNAHQVLKSLHQEKKEAETKIRQVQQQCRTLLVNLEVKAQEFDQVYNGEDGEGVLELASQLELEPSIQLPQHYSLQQPLFIYDDNGDDDDTLGNLDVSSLLWDLSPLHSLLEECLIQEATIRMQRDAALMSLERMEDHEHIRDDMSNDNNGDSVELCVTCGQSLSPELRAIREIELQKEVEYGTNALSSIQSLVECCKAGIEHGTAVNIGLEQLKLLLERKEGILEEVKKTEVLVLDTEDRLVPELSAAVNRLRSKRIELEGKLRESVEEHSEKLAAVEDKVRALKADLSSLREDEVTMRERQQLYDGEKAAYDTSIALIEEKCNRAREDCALKAVQVSNLTTTLVSLSSESVENAESSLVWQQLSLIFGNRGVQHFIFSNVLKQLELVCNSYLLVLSEGGIQITLQGGTRAAGGTYSDVDKVVKSVLIRGSDGHYRERGLSQLSGGQWRRVSLSLDLAFAECARRRGAYTSNLIVFDEVLTHLDARGREAVGGLLRRLVQADGVEEDQTTASTSTDATSALGAATAQYDTVLVILQDLAAQELQESFDHIDVVTRERDTSRVDVDGNNF